MAASPSTKRPAEPLTAEEVHRLLYAPSSRAPTGLRNRALIAIMYGAGLRLSEALALKPSDINYRDRSIRVLHGKGDKPRTPVVFNGSIPHIERWIDKRRELHLTWSRHLFCTLKGEKVKPRYVQAMVARMGARAGIDKRVHPHGLRHTHAVTLLNNGMNPRDIQIQLGHSWLSTTQTYLQDISPGDRAEKIRNMVNEI